MSTVHSAVLMVFILLASVPASFIPSVTSEQVTHFGNTGFPSSVNISFPSSGYDTSTNIVLGASAVASAASLDVRGWQGPLSSSPVTIGVDIGNDGDLEWAFGGAGNGTFGHINELSNGWERVALNLSTGTNSGYSLRLPLNATVTSASVNFSTLSELTLSGNDVWDTQIDNPNPTWGNSSLKDCNFGNYSHTRVGKTVWSNWHIYRSLYSFNLSQFPGTTVLDANLSFWVDNVVTNANSGLPVTTQHTYSVHPLLKDWVEGLEMASPVQLGPGATWNNAIDNLSGSDYSWTTAGASSSSDRDPSVASITETPANLKQNWMTFNSQSLTNLVQGWANGSITNQGVILIGDENTNKPDGSALTITSRGNASFGPRLVIVFEGTDDVTAGLDVGNDGTSEWSHAGNLSNGSTTPDLSASLNSILANSAPTFTDAWGNEFLDIPLGVNGNATLVMDGIDVEYDWSPTIGVSPNGDILTEINSHLSTLVPDATGNVTIDINVTSGSSGIVELSNLNINLGDRPPSVGALILPSETFVPNGMTQTVGLEVTSYQGIANLSWVALTPQIQDTMNRPVLIHSLTNGSTWATDPSGYLANYSGQWQALNADTGRMEWTIEVDWAWPPEQGVTWLAQVATIDNLYTDRVSSSTTDHERRMEITSFHLWDDTAPSDGGPEVFHNEWVAGSDQLSVSGSVTFLDVASVPQPGDVLVELENLSGNATVDENGDFTINSQAPSGNHYDGFTVTARIAGNLESTMPGTSTRTFRVDATLPGIMVHSPLGERVEPNLQQLFNISIADTIGLDDSSLMLRWWSEARHDDGDGLPQLNEYGTQPLLRQGGSEFFHATYDDTDNVHGQQVSLFVEGNDLAGNTIGTGPGYDENLLQYTTLVPSPTTLVNVSFEPSGGDVLVPVHPAWLNVTFHDENSLEDIERIVVDVGQSAKLTWEPGTGFISNNPEIQIEEYTILGEGNDVYLKLAFSITSLFNPASAHNQLYLSITDSSGEQSLGTGLDLQIDADIILAEFSISLFDDPTHTPLSDDSYVTLGARLLMSGRISYASADLPPPSESYQVWLEVPLDLPMLVQVDENGMFTGNMDALGSGLYQVTLDVVEGFGEVGTDPLPVRLQVDNQPPIIVGSAPGFIPINSTDFMLQFDIQETDAGLSSTPIPVHCQMMRGFQTVGEPVYGEAEMQISDQVSRYLVNLSFDPLQDVDSLDCWFELTDVAGNPLSGVGSAITWPLRLSVVEIRPDLVATGVTFSPNQPIFGQATSVNITLVNLGNHTDTPFTITIDALGQEVGRGVIQMLDGQQSTTVSITWFPDWKGELDLFINIDATEKIHERDENNTLVWRVDVKPVPTSQGFFGLTLAGAGGIALLICIAIGMFVMAMRFRQDEDESDGWDEDIESTPPSSEMGMVRPDGFEYLEWSDGDWYYRHEVGDEWLKWQD
ncbi:MAG: DNRLRE domain-containing protein [Candidatus Thalassarchaeaceae archaeon]|nr:DNRLRE domain-containing protein [Candidatus Thalassarchaeaceae archaeon]